MATRFYLPASGTAPLGSLAYDSSWGRSEGFVRRPTGTAKSNTSLATDTRTWANTSTNDWVWVQFQSKRLAAGYSWTTSDTVSMSMRVRENANQVDSHLSYVIRVVSGDGSTVRGTVGVYQSTSLEMTTTLATKIHDARTNGASNFSSQAGDRIIIEIGVYGVTPTLDQVDIRFGDPSAVSDCPLTADDVNDYCGWVELSRTVSFDLTSSKTAYTKGVSVATPGSCPAYLQGGLPTASSSKSAYLKGLIKDSHASFLKGGIKSQALPSFLRGGLKDNKTAYLAGGIQVNTSISVYLFGNPFGTDTSSSTLAFLLGAISSSQTISAFILALDNPLYPDGVASSSGTWLNEVESGSNLWLSIDEATANNSDYIWCTDPDGTRYIEFTMTNPPGTPGSGDVVVVWRGKDKSGLNIKCTIQLKQGDTLIAQQSSMELHTNVEQHWFQLTPAERANITDWNDLRIRIIPVEP